MIVELLQIKNIFTGRNYPTDQQICERVQCLVIKCADSSANSLEGLLVLLANEVPISRV